MKNILGILTLNACLMGLTSTSRAAAWEGSDDFSGTLGQWNTNYIHVGQPSDGFFLSGGHLQFIKTATTTNYESSGALIWPNSLPFSANWTVLVDAHLQPASAKTSDPVDQDVRAALYVFEDLSTFSTPYFKRLDAVLQNGTAGDEIRSTTVTAAPVTGGGSDFTLGISFDATTQIGTCFYYPLGQPSQKVVLRTLSVNGWTNMQVMLYGLSEYWAVGDGEDWLDNLRINSTGDNTITGTNVVANLNFGLTGYEGTDTAKPVRLDNKAILSLLDGVLTNPATGDSVSNHFVDAYGRVVGAARLIRVVPADSDGTRIKVRQVFNRTNIVDTDVAPWLRSSGSDSVGNERVRHSITHVSFDNGKAASFDVQGFATYTRGDLIGTSGLAKGVIVSDQTKTANVIVAGTGNLPPLTGASDSYTVLKGSIILSAAAVEVNDTARQK